LGRRPSGRRRHPLLRRTCATSPASLGRWPRRSSRSSPASPRARPRHRRLLRTSRVCDITPGTPNTSALEVELWSASAFAQQTVAFTNTGKPQRLRGLGHGAFYSPVKGDKNDGNVLFERGAYTVLIDPTQLGGPSADYPTEQQYLTLARAIYKHLG
jgi:hypothetical protein